MKKESKWLQPFPLVGVLAGLVMLGFVGYGIWGLFGESGEKLDDSWRIHSEQKVEELAEKFVAGETKEVKITGKQAPGYGISRYTYVFVGDDGELYGIDLSWNGDEFYRHAEGDVIPMTFSKDGKTVKLDEDGSVYKILPVWSKSKQNEELSETGKE